MSGRLITCMEGLIYRTDFVTPEEEADLLASIGGETFQEVRMMGAVARRTVVHYGYDYDYAGWSIHPTIPPPTYLEPYLIRASAAAGIDRARIEQILVARYPPGATIGWHRDAPMFGAVVIGLSLGSSCTMRFRRKVDGTFDRESLTLDPRSLYILSGTARSQWQHSIPPTPQLRYSITLRTLRRRRD